MKSFDETVLCRFCGTITMKAANTSTVNVVPYSFFRASTSFTPRNTLVPSTVLVLSRKRVPVRCFSCGAPKRMASTGEIFRKLFSTWFT